jgi:mannose-6-phosphate isomerase-like protein (cupin superfamily)
MDILSKENSLDHYQWGEACDGWVLVDEDSLSVKLERMPPHTSEITHYHQKALQFFYILRGEATFEIENKQVTAKKGEGVHIRPGQKHRILNNAAENLEFILSSQPSTTGDRINCE